MRRRARVLVVVNDLGLGGAQRAALDQAAELDAKRFQVEVSTLDLLPRGDGMLSDLPIHPRRRRPPCVARGVATLIGALRGFRPDVVHAHLMAAGIACASLRRAASGPRLVATLHNRSDWEERSRDPLRRLGRRALAECDALVAVSESVRAAVAAIDPGLAARTRVIPGGVSQARFRSLPSRAEALARLGLDPGVLVVGAVARCERRKGLDLLIEASRRIAPTLPRLRVLVVGDGPERSALEMQARALDPGRVRFVGEQADVRPYLAAMDVFAAPSRSEGQGLAILEALAAGLPVVAARVGGIPEMIEPEACGRLVAPDDPEALAEALLLETGGEEPGRSRWRSAATRTLERFSIEAAARSLESLYEELLSSRAALPLRKAA